MNTKIASGLENPDNKNVLEMNIIKRISAAAKCR
jgi:hypothetical protein